MSGCVATLVTKSDLGKLLKEPDIIDHVEEGDLRGGGLWIVCGGRHTTSLFQIAMWGLQLLSGNAEDESEREEEAERDGRHVEERERRAGLGSRLPFVSRLETMTRRTAWTAHRDAQLI